MKGPENMGGLTDAERPKVVKTVEAAKQERLKALERKVQVDTRKINETMDGVLEGTGFEGAVVLNDIIILVSEDGSYELNEGGASVTPNIDIGNAALDAAIQRGKGILHTRTYSAIYKGERLEISLRFLEPMSSVEADIKREFILNISFVDAAKDLAVKFEPEKEEPEALKGLLDAALAK